MKRTKQSGISTRSHITPRYRDLFKTMSDSDQKRVDAAFDAVLFDRMLAVPALIEQYQNSQDNAQLRYFCVQLLGFTDSRVALPTLIDALNDTDPDIRIEALYALEDQRCTEALPSIQLRLNDIHDKVRQIASEVCENIQKLCA